MSGVQSPVDHRREELGDESLIIWPELLDVARLVVFAIQIVRVECAHCIERLLVLLVCEMRVRVLAVPPDE